MKEFVAIRDITQQRTANLPQEQRERIYANYWPDVLEMNFRDLNQSRWTARIITFVFYSIGILVLSVPSIEVFYKVAVVTVRSVSALLAM